MPGLLDSQPRSGGLLSQPDDMRQRALWSGLIQAGAGLLGGRGNTLQNLGQGFAGFSQGFQGSMDQQRQQQLYDLQLKGLRRQDSAADKAAADLDAMAAALEGMDPPSEIRPQFDAMMAGGRPEEALKMWHDYQMKQAEAGMKPPTVRDFNVGSTTQPAQFQPGAPDVGFGPGWVPTGNAAPRWKAGPDTVVEAPKTLEERDRQIILTGDPASQEYALAYANLFLTPKIVQGENGAVPVMPHIPDGVRQPTYLAGTGGGGAAGAPTGLPTAAPALPGTFKPTEGQGLSSGYLRRMEAAEPIIKKFQAALTDPKQTVASQLPIAGNYMVSSEFQQAQQAASDWVRAKLRKESGAVIADEEMAREITTYFPQPGDRPEVIEQKRLARAEAVAALRAQAGPAAPPATTAPTKIWKVVNGELVQVN